MPVRKDGAVAVTPTGLPAAGWTGRRGGSAKAGSAASRATTAARRHMGRSLEGGGKSVRAAGERGPAGIVSLKFIPLLRLEQAPGDPGDIRGHAIAARGFARFQ